VVPPKINYRSRRPLLRFFFAERGENQKYREMSKSRPVSSPIPGDGYWHKC